jgi:hypothetical protein
MKRAPIDPAARVAAPTLVADLALVDGGMPSSSTSYSYKPTYTSQSHRDSQPVYQVHETSRPTERSTPYAYTPQRSSQTQRDSNPGGRSFMASRYEQR